MTSLFLNFLLKSILIIKLDSEITIFGDFSVEDSQINKDGSLLGGVWRTVCVVSVSFLKACN